MNYGYAICMRLDFYDYIAVTASGYADYLSVADQLILGNLESNERNYQLCVCLYVLHNVCVSSCVRGALNAAATSKRSTAVLSILVE